MILFSTVDEALELHRNLIDRFGGTHGVRDAGLLESALYRPQTGYYDDVVQMTAALLESLLINHPFVDGNKRVAFFLSDVFLRMNGWKIKTRPRAGYHFVTMAIGMKPDRFVYIEKWLRHHLARL